MGLFDFLRSKPPTSTPYSAPAYTFGGGHGLTPQSAVKVIPHSLDRLRNFFKEKLDGKVPENMTSPEALDGIIAEICKIAWLRSKFGGEGKEWECGAKKYLPNVMQSQEVRFSDGKTLVIFFDFSAIHPQGWF